MNYQNKSETGNFNRFPSVFPNKVEYPLFGQVTYSDCRIEIEPTLAPTRKTNVIIHELLHAALFEAGYDEQDEELVRRLGNVLTQVIGDNFATFDKLFEMEESE